MSKYYYLVAYSFDSEHRVVGPFDSRKACWEAMLKDAQNEYRIDTEENEWNSELIKDKQSGEITVTTYFDDGDSTHDETCWYIFELPQEV